MIKGSGEVCTPTLRPRLTWVIMAMKMRSGEFYIPLILKSLLMMGSPMVCGHGYLLSDNGGVPIVPGHLLEALQNLDEGATADEGRSDWNQVIPPHCGEKNHPSVAAGLHSVPEDSEVRVFASRLTHGVYSCLGK